MQVFLFQPVTNPVKFMFQELTRGQVWQGTPVIVALGEGEAVGSLQIQAPDCLHGGHCSYHQGLLEAWSQENEQRTTTKGTENVKCPYMSKNQRTSPEGSFYPCEYSFPNFRIHYVQAGTYWQEKNVKLTAGSVVL